MQGLPLFCIGSKRGNFDFFLEIVARDYFASCSALFYKQTSSKLFEPVFIALHLELRPTFYQLNGLS